jgi:hypothetical protein
MAEGPSVQLNVALRYGGDTISGTVDDRSGQTVQFSGWLELMSAFEAFCARACGSPPRDADSVARDGR